MSVQDFELEDEELEGEWYDCEKDEESYIPIGESPIYSYVVMYSLNASIVVKIYDKTDWYQNIIRRIITLWSEVNPRTLKNPGIRLSLLHKLKQELKSPVNMGPDLIDSAFNEYLTSLPMKEDSDIEKLIQEIDLWIKECYIQVFILDDSQDSVLKCSETSCLDILNETWDTIVNEMYKQYPTVNIFVFVPETIFSQKYLYSYRYDTVEGMVSQAQADATWMWLLKKGFKYCGTVVHDNDEYPLSNGTHNNNCPFFKYSHGSTNVPNSFSMIEEVVVEEVE
jgi:hypothetical protein